MGLLFVDPLDDFSWSFVRRHGEIDLADAGRIYAEMEERVVGNLSRQGVARGRDRRRAQRRLCYVGQLHSVTVPLEEISEQGVEPPSRASTTSTCASTATRTRSRRSRPRRCA